ncbi:MAG: helix-turn-helix domain-containing protein [Clostridia bacterium]|nr:helix-turn-helix domain-containing protein [Clostridia bacterium]
MKFNERLIKLRKQMGLSQEELGFQLDVTRQTVSKWELGETTPVMDKLVEMADFFGLSIDELVRDESQYNSVSRTRGGYEYKSGAEIMGVPVIHINIGPGRRRAKGVIAIGNIATGVVAVGGLSVGVVAVGGFTIGIVAFGGLALGILALGGLAGGYIALGGVALGYMALGGVAYGTNAIGGAAIARDIALGGYAKGTIAIGDEAHGTAALHRLNLTLEEFRSEVNMYLPEVKSWVLRLFERILFK